MRIVALGDRDPQYLTHREIDAALEHFPRGVQTGWLATDDPAAQALDDADGIWLLPGTPYREEAVAHAAISHCLRTGTPFLGTCGGFQHACLVLARERGSQRNAAHAESDPGAIDPLIAPLACTLYGERRTVHPIAGTRLADICGDQPFEGFHYCGYGITDGNAEKLAKANVTISATAPDAGVEAIELPDHPFFLATAFQPQVGVSETGRLPPLLTAFLRAARS
jgi:CTP synthase (UTP-ammonia lyase)